MTVIRRRGVVIKRDGKPIETKEAREIREASKTEAELEPSVQQLKERFNRQFQEVTA